MDKDKLKATAEKMVAKPKGILAMDESTGTCTKRFETIGVESTEENRKKYRTMLATAEGLENYVSGAILFDETLRQGIGKELEAKGIIPGIKVDTGAKELALHEGEKVTEGLDGLRERLKEYAELGCGFAKWRAVITIKGDALPTEACIDANAHGLARYAALCQEAGIVPIVEPEVLMDGDHSIERCYKVSADTLSELFEELEEQGVYLPGCVLKASMVISGKDAAERADVQTVAEQTVKCLKENVPADCAGVVFLSGGQSNEEATDHLNAMNKLGEDLPWPLSFSYGRALQSSALVAWGENIDEFGPAQEQLLERAKANSLATEGKA